MAGVFAHLGEILGAVGEHGFAVGMAVDIEVEPVGEVAHGFDGGAFGAGVVEHFGLAEFLGDLLVAGLGAAEAVEAAVAA